MSEPSDIDRTFQKEINDRIAEFVADITQLAREHAYRSLAGALDVAPGPGGKAKRARPSRSKTGQVRRKRGQAELIAVSEELLQAITEEPGRRMQELAAQLNSTPKELSLPAKRLIFEKMVRTEGQKRSTSYFPTAKGKKSAG